MELVIDASVALAWCFRDKRTEATASLLERVQTDTAAVPNLWHLEVANVLALAERRGRITPAESTELIALLEMLEIVVDGETLVRAFSRVLDLAREAMPPSALASACCGLLDERFLGTAIPTIQNR